jgi:conjugative relaxase-like TrwC/TraI family protein
MPSIQSIRFRYQARGRETTSECSRLTNGTMSVSRNGAWKTSTTGASNHPAETTGKWAAAKFEHDSARPIDGYSAPQLHTHVVFFNVTETADGRTRALQPQELYRSQKFATAVYQSELAWRLRRLGHEIDPGKNGAPEIRGYTREYLGRAVRAVGRSAGILKRAAWRARARPKSRRTAPETPRPRSVRARCSRATARSPPRTGISRSESWTRRGAAESSTSRPAGHRTLTPP